MFPDLDDSTQRTSRLIFRVMLSGIFLVAGSNHMLRHDAILGRLEQAPMSWLATAIAPPDILVFLAGIGLLIGGLSLFAGFATRWAALGLMLIIIPITVTVQIGSIRALGPLFKNIGLMGGLVYFITHGAKAPSVDALLSDN